MSAAVTLLYGIAAAYITTCVIEGIVTLLMTKSPRFLLFNLWCNTLTNPLLNIGGILVMHFAGGRAFAAYTVMGEAAVLFAEARLYARFDKRSHTDAHYFLLSLVTNSVSVIAGLYVSAG